MKISVAVFAHNEEHNLDRAIRALLSGRAYNSNDIQIHILANGCTDNTYSIASAMSRCDSRLYAHNIAFADKSNAWNRYVYDIAPQSCIHCFTDGDCFVSEDALFKTLDALRSNPYRRGLAGLPLTGRNKASLTSYIEKFGWIYGGFYAIQGEHLSELVKKNISLPVGLIGDDGYVGNFIRMDPCNPTSQQVNRVFTDPFVGFNFDEIKLFSTEGIKKYLNRQANYYIRQQQFDVLRGTPMDRLPKSTAEVDSIIALSLSKNSLLPFLPVLRLAAKKLSVKLKRGYSPDEVTSES
jgi:glycosyltransferase involved in cell wall biosynthesis